MGPLTLRKFPTSFLDPQADTLSPPGGTGMDVVSSIVWEIFDTKPRLNVEPDFVGFTISRLTSGKVGCSVYWFLVSRLQTKS